MTANWALDKRLSVRQLISATRVTDATAVSSTALDLSTLGDGVRPVVVLSAFETNTGNTGGTWTVTESATSGGEYTSATLSTALTATPAAAGNDIQSTAILPNAAKPFVKVTYTGADASTEVDITAVLIVAPRVI